MDMIEQAEVAKYIQQIARHKQLRFTHMSCWSMIFLHFLAPVLEGHSNHSKSRNIFKRQSLLAW